MGYWIRTGVMRVFIASAISLISVQSWALLPDGFELEIYASDLARPTDIEWSSTGVLYVAEKSGTVSVVQNGTVLPEVFIDIGEQVNRAIDRGLLGISLHPDFPDTPYMYLLHTYDPPETVGNVGEDKPNGKGQRVSRLIRVTADATTNYQTAVPGSEIVILGKASTWGNIGDPTAEQNDPAPFSCGPDGAYVDDCIPADGWSHSIGDVSFGPDGMLYVTNGDNSSWSNVNAGALRALRVDSLSGKLLRIDPETGLGLPDNPYWDGDPNSNRSRVWQLGLRNPFRFSFNPEDGKAWIADVGWEDWEELNQGPPGTDFGWPCYEGSDIGPVQQPGYSARTECQAYYATDMAAAPAYAYPHRSGFGGAIIIGEFYQATKWPSEYQGTVMLGDYSFQELSIARISGDTATVIPFADEVLSVDLAVGPDGDIYSANIATGDIEVIRYTGSGGGTGGGGSSGGGTGGNGDIQVAGFVGDFRGPAPKPGWSYSWNANGPLGSPSVELPLLWTGTGSYDSDGAPGLPDATAMNFGFLASGVMHPGKGIAQGESDDRFAIARFTVAEDGEYSLRNGQVQANGCEFTNGFEVAILVNDQIIHQHTVTDADPVAEDLGTLAAGSSIGVAVGPNGTDGCDKVAIDWEIFQILDTAPTGDAPVVIIDSPLDNQFMRVDEVIFASGSATDTEDGVIGADALLWEGTIIHNTHMHPGFLEETGPTAPFTYPDHGDNSYLQLCLTATDADNNKSQSCVDVRPELVTYNFDSSPVGLLLSYNGESAITPFSVEVPVGGTRQISAPWLQGDLIFNGWSNGGQASQQIVAGDVDQTFAASYSALPGNPVQQAISAVSASADDAGESGTGAVILDQVRLTLVPDGDQGMVGLHFPGIGIEPGAAIMDAYIQFTADADSGDPTALRISIASSDNAATFAAQQADISSRPLANAFIDWAPTAWLAPGEAAIAQRTPSLVELVTEIVNRPGWQSGNDLAFVIGGEGRRIARAFDSPDGGAPTLFISFVDPDANPSGAGAAAGGGGGGGGSLGWLMLLSLLAIGAATRRRTARCRP